MFFRTRLLQNSEFIGKATACLLRVCDLSQYLMPRYTTAHGELYPVRHYLLCCFFLLPRSNLKSTRSIKHTIILNFKPPEVDERRLRTNADKTPHKSNNRTLQPPEHNHFIFSREAVKQVT